MKVKDLKARKLLLTISLSCFYMNQMVFFPFICSFLLQWFSRWWCDDCGSEWCNLGQPRRLWKELWGQMRGCNQRWGPSPLPGWSIRGREDRRLLPTWLSRHHRLVSRSFCVHCWSRCRENKNILPTVCKMHDFDWLKGIIIIYCSSAGLLIFIHLVFFA